MLYNKVSLMHKENSFRDYIYSVKLSNRCIIVLIDMAFIYQPIYGLVRFIIIIIQRKKMGELSTLYERLFSSSVFLMNLLAILYVCLNYVKVKNIFHNYCYLHTVVVYAITEHKAQLHMYTVLNINHWFFMFITPLVGARLYCCDF